MGTIDWGQRREGHHGYRSRILGTQDSVSNKLAMKGQPTDARILGALALIEVSVIALVVNHIVYRRTGLNPNPA
jgi:hypothetical protein